MAETEVAAGDIYHVEMAPGMYWFVESVSAGKACARCLRSKRSSWVHGQRTDIKKTTQNVIVRNLPDFECANAYMALHGGTNP